MPASPAADCRADVAPVARRVTTRLDPSVDLLSLLPEPTGGLAFVVEGDGLVGWGEFASLRVTGVDAAAQIERWFAAISSDIDPAAGAPVCFVSLGFSPSDESVAVVPHVVVRRSGGRAWMTSLGPAQFPGPAQSPGPARDSGDGRGDDGRGGLRPVTAPGEVRYFDAQLSTTDFMAAVEIAVGRIRAGAAQKVVLAHGLTATTERDVDERFLLSRLAVRYPSCAVFAVAGLVGASPEMLVHRRGTAVSSRVLAGTAWPDHPRGGSSADTADDTDRNAGREISRDMGRTAGRDVAAALTASAKDLAEHRFAALSVARALETVTTTLTVPATPSTLPLANLTHLVTDITGELDVAAGPAPSALRLAALLHPTAAVGGTPTDIATAMIAELERAPRGRYAAPVGWMDPHGDGDFAIALRCAQVDGRTVTMTAGCGIVAQSDPATEAREAQIKMLPIRDALEG